MSISTPDTEAGLLRLQLAVKLSAVCFQAKRVMPKTKTFEADPPTAWDVHHAHLDEMLTELQACG